MIISHISRRVEWCDLPKKPEVINRKVQEVELNRIVHDHYDKAKSNNVYNVMTQMLYFKSKLFLLEDNYNQAEECLFQSLLLSEEHGLDGLHHKIEQDLQKLKNDADFWYKAFEHNTSLSTRLDMLQMENYFEEVKKLVRI